MFCCHSVDVLKGLFALYNPKHDIYTEGQEVLLQESEPFLNTLYGKQIKTY